MARSPKTEKFLEKTHILVTRRREGIRIREKSLRNNRDSGGKSLKKKNPKGWQPLGGKRNILPTRLTSDKFSRRNAKGEGGKKYTAISPVLVRRKGRSWKGEGANL